MRSDEQTGWRGGQPDFVKSALELEFLQCFCPSYDLGCAILSSFNFMVIFNIASADITESHLMLY